MAKTLLKVKECEENNDGCVDLRVKKGTKATHLYMAAAAIVLKVAKFNGDSIQRALKNVEQLVDDMDAQVQPEEVKEDV